MRILISWSGKESHEIAIVLKDWLPVVVPAEPWVSSEDIRKGKRWTQELAKCLEDIQFGILCMTINNKTAPWIHFEAGALSKWVDKAYVVPLLFGGFPMDSLSEPLQQFQAALFRKDDMQKLVLDINQALGENAIKEDQLKKSFAFSWHSVEKQINSILDTSNINPDLPAADSESQNSNKIFEIKTEHVTILSAIGQSEDGLSTKDELVPVIGMNLVRLEHYLEELVDHDFLNVTRGTMVGSLYKPSRKGREYMMNEGII